jgi:hypothetical protein
MKLILDDSKDPRAGVTARRKRPRPGQWRTSWGSPLALLTCGALLVGAAICVVRRSWQRSALGDAAAAVLLHDEADGSLRSTRGRFRLRA